MRVTRILASLADPTRRGVYEDIVERGEVSATELVTASGVSQPAVSQHLKVLRDSGLVHARRSGRSVRYRANPRALAPLVDWLGMYAAFWQTRLANLEQLLEEIDS